MYKVFGRHESEVVRRLKDGADRSELADMGTAAVIDASFEVARGETFVVMGLSGSGKSTLIRMVNGLWAPSSGRIEVNGEDVSAMGASQLRQLRRDHISMVFQHFALLPHQTVRENAAYGLRLQGVGRRERFERADRWLDTVGLHGWGDKYPHQLSGGMQQRVGLARALAAETDILLMDEAFSALDPVIRREMQDQLVELQAQLGKTIIFITHDLNEAMYLGDRIAVMRDGRIRQIGTSEEILTTPADDYVEDFIQDVDRTRVLTASSVMQETRAVISNQAGPRTAIRIMESLDVSGLFVVDRSRRLLGTIDDSLAVEAAHRRHSTIANIVQTSDVLTVGTDTAMSQLFAPSASASVPLAVVDRDLHLLGIIPRVALLDAMGQTSVSPGVAGSDDEVGGEHPAASALPDTMGEPVDTGGPKVGLVPADSLAAPAAMTED